MAPTDIPIDQLLQKDIELDLTESRGPMMKWSGVGMTIAVVVIVTLRMISRAFLLKRVYKDDYCILISTILVICLCAFNWLGVDNGLGTHFAAIPDKRTIPKMFKMIYATGVFYTTSILFTKASMLFQLLRLTVRKSKKYYILLGVFGVSMSFSIAHVFMMVFFCTPINYMWKLAENPMADIKGRCMTNKEFALIGGSLNIVMDFAIWLIPLPVIHQLQIPRSQKISLVFVFSIGLFICGTAIARVIQAAKLDSLIAKTGDFPYYQTKVFFWSVLEANLAIICASLPPLRPLLKLALPEVFGSLNDSRGVGASGEERTRDTVKLGGIRRDDNPFDGYNSSGEELGDLSRTGAERLSRDAASVETAEKEGVERVEIRSRP